MARHPVDLHAKEAEMVDCAYCEKPLVCDNCRAEYVPATEEHYRALSQPDALLTCTGCGEVLVCHWCKTPYDGSDEETTDAASQGA
jgi:hypothetical protein